jgi:hypothetical protein
MLYHTVKKSYTKKNQKKTRQEILTKERVLSMNVSFFFFLSFLSEKDLRKSGEKNGKKKRKKTRTPFQRDFMIQCFFEILPSPEGLSNNTAKVIRYDFSSIGIAISVVTSGGAGMGVVTADVPMLTVKRNNVSLLMIAIPPRICIRAQPALIRPTIPVV